MVWFVLSLLLLAVGLGSLITGLRIPKAPIDESRSERGKSPNPRTSLLRTGFGATGVGLLLLLPSVLYSQTPGQANVLTNLGGGVSSVDVTTGFGAKAPWQGRSTWDLLSQTATYAGTDAGAPSYTNGDIQGREVTVSLARGVQAFIDVALTYSVEGDSEQITALYNEFRSQESFTRQIVQNTVLSTLREAPNAMSPSRFRGEGRAEFEADVLESLNESLDSYGVTFTQVNLQDVRFTEDVENSLRAVEVAQQREAEAEANLRATEIEAQAQVVQAEQAAEAAIAEAQGLAEANRLLAESLTPEVIESRRIEALREAGAVYVVPEGSTPFVQVPAPAPRD